ncbi:MAG: SPOR domain-containing protein [Bacteroidales bacterium]|nr:SPOR domain-containing protein [Bacteroidales bacterium]
MKKVLLFAMAATMVLTLGSCKSKQSAYKAAYEKAKAKDVEQAVEEVEEQPVMKTPSAKYSGAAVQSEKVTAVNPNEAGNLKAYSVVIGSFINKTNATSLRDQMIDKGFNAFLAQNAKGMYRVIVASYNDKADAAETRDRIKAKYAPLYADSWILLNQ